MKIQKFYNSQHSLLGHGYISAGNKMNLRELLLLIMAGQAIRSTDILRIIRQDRTITAHIWDGTETQRGLGNFPSEASVDPEEVEKLSIWLYNSLIRQTKQKSRKRTKQAAGMAGKVMLEKSPGLTWGTKCFHHSIYNW